MAAGYLVAIIRKRRNLDSSPSGDVYRRAYLYGGYQRTGSGSDPYFGVGIGVNASDSVKVTGEFNFVAAELRKVTLAVVGQAILPSAAFQAAFSEHASLRKQLRVRTALGTAPAPQKPGYFSDAGFLP